MTRSIHEQLTDFRYRSIESPKFVLMSHRTKMDLLSEISGDSILVYSDKGVIKIFGLEVVPVDWIPDGIAVVTDTYEEDEPGTFYLGGKKVTFDWSKIKLTSEPPVFSAFTSKLWGTYTRDWATTTAVSSGTSVSFDPSTLYSMTISTTSTPTIIPFEGTAKLTPEEVWAERIVEEQEPDPDSIYGKALARARASSIEST